MPNLMAEEVYKVLAQLQIPYVRHDHPAVFTCAEADQYYEHISGGKSKNLFLRNKKGDRHFLVIVESSKKVNLAELGKVLQEDKLSFASPERLLKHLGLTPGSVSPFGLIHDQQKEVRLILDEDLLKHERLHYHPNVNTATVELSREDFLKFLEYCGNPLQKIKL